MSKLPGGQPLSGDDAFAYIYAVLHSPNYRARYCSAMRNDFPSIPIARGAGLVRALVAAGQRLLDVHLGVAQPSIGTGVGFHDGGDRRIRRVGEPHKRLLDCGPSGGRLHINDVSYFTPIAGPIWDLRIGAYRIAHKWLDDRRRAGRSLSDAEVTRYIDVLARLGETLRLQAVIDSAVAEGGGFPNAFETGVSGADGADCAIGIQSATT